MTHEHAEFDDFVDDDLDDEADDDLICPSCRGAVHAETQQCPHCGDWIIPVDYEKPWKRRVWVLAVVLVVLSFLLTALL